MDAGELDAMSAKLKDAGVALNKEADGYKEDGKPAWFVAAVAGMGEACLGAADLTSVPYRIICRKCQKVLGLALDPANTGKCLCADCAEED